MRSSTTHGPLEVRVAVEGTQRIWGVTLNELPGSTIQEKLRSVVNMGFVQLEAAVKSNGFYFIHEADTALVIPPKFAVVILTTKDGPSFGLKYSIRGSEKNLKQSVELLTKLLNDYPALKGGTRDALLTSLKSRVASGLPSDATVS